MFKILFKEWKKKVRSARIAFLEKYFPPYQENRATDLAMAGRMLTDDQAAMLEKRIEENPADIDVRILLLGKYGERQFRPIDLEEQRLRHVEWIVRHRPDHAIAGLPFAQFYSGINQSNYQCIKDLWLEQVERRNEEVAVLANAAKFFVIEDKEIAERFLLVALEIRPTDRRLRQSLAQLYSLWDGHSDQALVELEKIVDKRDSEKLFYELTDLPKAAFDAGQFDKAADAAQKLLTLSKKYRRNWNYGNAVNEAHTVLGMVALKNGNTDKAKHHLKESIIDIATPQTRSFGPSLDLAADLLNVGETTAVIQYLDEFELLCGVDNERAFEVRYNAEHGTESMATDLGFREHYEQAFREHQFHALEARSPVARSEHLRELIKRTRARIETWVHRIEQVRREENTELLEYAERTKQREQEHLQKLESLVLAEDRK